MSNRLDSISDREEKEEKDESQPSSGLCDRIIFVVFIVLLGVIFNNYVESIELVGKINQVEGRIAQFIPVYSGELHYSRIVPEYWEHRIQMVKALGFNSISVYVMWNFHEVSKGVFDYQSPNKNLGKFLDIATKAGMNVLLRPGPYVCA